MANQRHLKHAPLTEAVIDFRVDTLAPDHYSALKTLADSLGEDFPVIEEKLGYVASWAFRPGELPKPQGAETGFIGFLCKSQDGRTIAQFRRDGFTLNRLEPYTSWEELLPQALTLWAQYAHATQTQAATRLGLRYINRLSVPIGDDLQEYLVSPPSPPANLAQTLLQFLTNIVVWDPDLKITSAITQALEPPEGDAGSILLDIDVSREDTFDATGPAIRETLEVLRDRKNTIFFGSVTESVIGRYE
jgi:uncharacterized protein (TIGR04255 family)